MMMELYEASTRPLLPHKTRSTRDKPVNKFLHDDKGSTLIACWGLPPTPSRTTPRDASGRAAFASLTELGLRPSIGVTKGDAYCVRHRVDPAARVHVLGDSINLAARLMAQKNGVIVDASIASETSLTVEALGEVQVKGRNAPVAIYRPTNMIRATHDEDRIHAYYTVVVSKAAVLFRMFVRDY